MREKLNIGPKSLNLPFTVAWEGEVSPVLTFSRFMSASAISRTACSEREAFCSRKVDRVSLSWRKSFNLKPVGDKIMFENQFSPLTRRLQGSCAWNGHNLQKETQCYAFYWHTFSLIPVLILHLVQLKLCFLLLFRGACAHLLNGPKLPLRWGSVKMCSQV